MKIYLDTNMIHDYFVNQAIALRKKGDAVLPSKYKFMLTEKDRIEFVTSFITKAEVVRELRSAHGTDAKTIEVIWNDLIDALSCEYIEKFEFDEKLVDIALKMPLRLRTLFNFMHLFIAMNLDCYIVSGDDDFVQKVKESMIYQKIINYIELRKLSEGI